MKSPLVTRRQMELELDGNILEDVKAPGSVVILGEFNSVMTSQFGGDLITVGNLISLPLDDL